MPKPTNHEQFYDEWHAFRLKMGTHIAKSETKQEQMEKDIEGLYSESEKNKKFRHKTTAIGGAVGTGTIAALFKAFWHSIGG